MAGNDLLVTSGPGRMILGGPAMLQEMRVMITPSNGRKASGLADIFLD